MIKIIVCSIITSGIVSYVMIKYQMRMINKWMNDFFEKEEIHIIDQIKKDQAIQNKSNDQKGDLS